MPYEISFTAPEEVQGCVRYFDECCWGGDLVRDYLMPSILPRYEEVSTEQEDWGWYIWFRTGQVHLSIDIACEDIERRRFRIHLASKIRKRFFRVSTVDTEELEPLRDLVVSLIQDWGEDVMVERVEK